MQELENITVSKITGVTIPEHQRGAVGDMKKRQCYGLSFCSKGHITFTMNDETVELTSDSAVLLPQNGSYSWECHKSGTYPQINFYTTELFTDKILKIEIGSYAHLESALKELQNAIITSSRARAMSVFYGIINDICGKAIQGNGIISRSVDYLLNNYSDISLSNKVLAEKSDISEIYFRKLFKESFGVTPKQFIIDLRIKKACKLLAERQNNVSEIAEQCGFSSVYHFCRAFKNITSLTPTEYAKQNESYSNTI